MADMSETDSATIARIDERTRAQGDAFAHHVTDDKDHFDKVLNFVSKRFDAMDERFDKIDAKLEPLQNESNQRKGASGVSKLIASGAYACVALAAGYFGGKHS